MSLDSASEFQPPRLSSTELVIPIPKELIHPDTQFPAIAVKSSRPSDIAAVCAKQVTDDEAMEGFTTEASANLGRGTIGKNVLKLETIDGLRSASSILTKSTGVPLAVRDHWQSYKGKPAFFYHEPTEADRFGDRKAVLTHNPDFLGISTKQDQVVDAQQSIALHTLGAKVRLPLAGWEVDSFQVKDKDSGQLVRKTIDWFKSQGFKGNELYQSAWAMSCPFRIEDVNDCLVEAIGGEKVDLLALDGFIRTMTAMAKADRSPEYQEVFQKWGQRTQADTSLTQFECVEALEDFGFALSKTMGKNYEIMYQNKRRHVNLSPQNISFFGELCDNSAVTKGLLKIGDAGKDDDIDGFKLTMGKYAERILQLKGEDSGAITGKLEEYLSTVFYVPLRASWTTYKRFCKETYTADIVKKLQSQRDGILEAIRADHGENAHFSPKEMGYLISHHLRRMTIKQWPFGEVK